MVKKWAEIKEFKDDPSLKWVDLFLAKNFVCRFLIFAYRGHLQALKIHNLNLFMSESIVRLRDQKIKDGF
jgi:hypothetical protein